MSLLQSLCWTSLYNKYDSFAQFSLRNKREQEVHGSECELTPVSFDRISIFSFNIFFYVAGVSIIRTTDELASRHTVSADPLSTPYVMQFTAMARCSIIVPSITL